MIRAAIEMREGVVRRRVSRIGGNGTPGRSVCVQFLRDSSYPRNGGR